MGLKEVAEILIAARAKEAGMVEEAENQKKILLPTCSNQLILLMEK